MRYKKLLMAVAAAGAAMSVAAIVFAQNASLGTASPAAVMTIRIAQSGKGQLAGTVAGISGSSVSVNGWGGTWIIDATNAKLVRRYGGASSVSEMKSGDLVVVDGTFSATGWAVTATQVRDMSIQTKDVYPVGAISNLDTTAGTFTLTTASGKTYSVSAAATTKVTIGRKAGAISNLANGERAQVWGVLDRTESTIAATKIVAAVPKTTTTKNSGTTGSAGNASGTNQ